jgi:hypothetical protein
MAVVFVAAAIAFVAVGQPDTVQSVSWIASRWILRPYFSMINWKTNQSKDKITNVP